MDLVGIAPSPCGGRGGHFTGQGTVLTVDSSALSPQSSVRPRFPAFSPLSSVLNSGPLVQSFVELLLRWHPFGIKSLKDDFYKKLLCCISAASFADRD